MSRKTILGDKVHKLHTARSSNANYMTIATKHFAMLAKPHLQRHHLSDTRQLSNCSCKCGFSIRNQSKTKSYEYDTMTQVARILCYCWVGVLVFFHCLMCAMSCFGCMHFYYFIFLNQHTLVYASC